MLSGYLGARFIAEAVLRTLLLGKAVVGVVLARRSLELLSALIGVIALSRAHFVSRRALQVVVAISVSAGTRSRLKLLFHGVIVSSALD